MKMQRVVLMMGLAFGWSILSVPASAAQSASFDLYSWAQKGSTNFCYAVVPAPEKPLAVSTIKAAKDQVCGGRDDFKRIVGLAVPLKSTLTWKVDAANGFVLPARDIVNDFARFAETIPYTLVLPESK